MFTCCPDCKTCFRITDEQLAIAKGLVRCGHCQKVFNGSNNLTANLPDNEPDEFSLDTRHEADEHDSGIFAADFSATNYTEHAGEQLTDEDENIAPSPATQHSDLPSFSAQDNFIDDSEEDDAIDPPFTPQPEIEADDWFLQKDDEDEQVLTAAQTVTESDYQYSDIADKLEEEQNIDDIFSDMNQQLELGVAALEENEAGAGILNDDATRTPARDKKEEKTFLNDEDEINQAIDNIFAESGLPLFGEQQDDHDDRVEKEMLAAFGENARIENHDDEIKFDDEAISLDDRPHPLNDDLPAAATKTTEPNIPRRLRDSLAIAEPEKTSLWKISLSLSVLLVLSIVLLAQLALFRNIEIVNYFPQSRPWLEQFCQLAPCRIHTQRDIEQIKILERDIRAHPQDKKALLITATLINKASFNQPYPNIRVTLSDLTGSVVAQRRFVPAYYLGSLNSPFLLMKTGTPVHINIGVLDPGRDAVNFEFEFM